MWDSIFKFIGPILQSVLAGAATQGVNQLMAPKPQRPPMAQAQGAGMVPGAPPGVGGSGTTSNPSGTMNFGGGYTGGPDPRQMGGNAPAGSPSTGFTTMGFPSTDQSKMRKLLEGQNQGFQGI